MAAEYHSGGDSGGGMDMTSGFATLGHLINQDSNMNIMNAQSIGKDLRDRRRQAMIDAQNAKMQRAQLAEQRRGTNMQGINALADQRMMAEQKTRERRFIDALYS